MSSPWHDLATNKRSVKNYTLVFNPLGIHGITCQDLSEGFKDESIYGSEP